MPAILPHESRSHFPVASYPADWAETFEIHTGLALRANENGSSPRRAVAAECRTLGRATPTGASKRRRWRGSVLAISSAVAAATGRLRIKGRKWPVVVLVCLIVIGMVLFLAQDPRTLHVESRLPSRTRPFRTTSRASSTPPSPAATPTRRPSERRRDLSGDARGDHQREAPDRLRDLQLQTRRDRRDLHPGADRGRPARRRRPRRARLVRRHATAARSRERLRAAGARLQWFNVLGLWTVEATNNRTHRKILVVDGEIGFTGGAGRRRSLARRRRRDGPLARHAVLGERTGGPLARSLLLRELGRSRRRGRAGAGSGRAGGRRPRRDRSWSGATRSAASATSSCSSSIRSPRPRAPIEIQSPYFIPDASSRRALLDARQRGVEIRV